MRHLLESTQNKVLQKLLRKSARTEYGRRFNFAGIRDYKTYASQVPLVTYNEIESYIERMKSGEKNILWPGRVTNYAVSSGTTGKGKHIPLTEDRFHSDQRFMRKVIFTYMKQHPDFYHLFFGSHVSLPGKIERVNGRSQVWLGDVSGYLAKLSPGWLGLFQVRRPHTMILESWSDKFNHTLDRALQSDVRQISTTPFWAMQFFQKALDRTGKSTVRDIWPNLALFICGGEALGTYRPYFDRLLDGLEMDYVENYGASESYFAYSSDQERNDLHLVTDNGCFFEWIPNPSMDRQHLHDQKTVPTWEVETGVPYGLVVSSNSGLYRYVMNDVVRFTDVQEPRIEVIGRVSEVLDQFGEKLESYEMKNALDICADTCDAKVAVFIMGGMIDPENGLPRHYWFVQWVKRPGDIQHFSELLDGQLRKGNRHYDMRRDVGLEMPVIMDLTSKMLSEWTSTHLSKAAQVKIPRIVQDEKKLSGLLAICRENLSPHGD